MKIERKYMAHFLNATFGGDTGTASYVRLGKDLEEYSPELSANVEKKQNILGQTSVTIDSYQKQGEVSPYSVSYTHLDVYKRQPRAYEHEYLGIPTGTGGEVFSNLELAVYKRQPQRRAAQSQCRDRA